MTSTSDDPRRRWRQISALLDDALDRPADERATFVASACDDDPQLREEALALLRAAEASPPFLDGGLAGLVPRAVLESFVQGTDVTNESGAEIGPYRLTRLIGRGGMGAVYEAERRDGQFEHRVALKLLPAHGGDSVRKRLVLERQVLARLIHPGIARLLDGGVTDDDRPYFVMDLVDGEPIDRYCREHGIGLDGRLRLVVDVCEAVQAAHRNLVIHRDLKPSNILVEDSGDAGEPQVKLLDFGIAKVLDDVVDGQSGSLTGTGERWMTPSYAAPEQIRGESTTTATDVYQIGVLLYELLTGERPFSQHESGPYDRQRAICEEAPTPPSRTTGRRRRKDLPLVGVASGKLRGDLDAIVLKALRKEPQARYSSVEAMAEDLQRYLCNEPVLARLGTARYRLAKFVQRNRVPVGISAAAALVLVLASVIYAFNLSKSRDLAQQAAETAQAEATKKDQIVDFLVDVFAEADPNEQPGEAATVTEVLDRASRRVFEELDGQPLEQAQLLRTLGEVQSERGQYEQAQLLLEAALERYEASGSHAEGEVLETKRLLVNHFAGRRDFAAAEPIAREVHASTLARYGPAHAKTAWAKLSHGSVLVDQGRLEDAEGILVDALSIARGLPDEAELLDSALHGQARLWRALGKLQEAEIIYRELLQRKAAAGSARTIGAATLWNNLGYSLRLQERFEEASEAYESALEITASIYGETHPTYLLILQNLASVFGKAGNQDAFLRVLDQRLELAKEAFPRPHWRLGEAYMASGEGRMAAGDAAGAIPLLAEAAAIHAASLGDDHSWTAMARTILAACYAMEGRQNEAEELRERSLAVYRELETLRDDHGPALERAASTYASLGMDEIAEEYRVLLARVEQAAN